MREKNQIKQKTWLVISIVFFAHVFVACSFEDLKNYDPYAALQQPASRSPPTPKPTTTPQTCIVTAQESLNLRIGPGTSYAVINWLKTGEVLTITNEPDVDAWIQVITDTHITGWINSNFCIRKNKS